MQICHNTRKTNPWVKAKVTIGRCMSYIRTGDQSTTMVTKIFVQESQNSMNRRTNNIKFELIPFCFIFGKPGILTGRKGLHFNIERFPVRKTL